MKNYEYGKSDDFQIWEDKEYTLDDIAEMCYDEFGESTAALCNVFNNRHGYSNKFRDAIVKEFDSTINWVHNEMEVIEEKIERTYETVDRRLEFKC